MCPTLTLLLDITYHSFTRSHNRAQQSIYSLTSFPITQEYCPATLTHSQTASRLHSLGPMRVGPHRLQIVIVNRRRFPGVPLLHHRHSHSLFFTISSSVVLKVWHLPYYDLYPSEWLCLFSRPVHRIKWHMTNRGSKGFRQSKEISVFLSFFPLLLC